MIEKTDLENKRFTTVRNNTQINLHGVAPGESVRIRTDKSGVPVDPHWRRRLKDAAVDNCISVEVKNTRTKKGDK